MIRTCDVGLDSVLAMQKSMLVMTGLRGRILLAPFNPVVLPKASCLWSRDFLGSRVFLEAGKNCEQKNAIEQIGI